jgi:hypothetical protein
MLFTRVAPRTKRQGIPINTPHIFYYFQHVLHRVQKARDSIVMCSKFIILLIKFSKVFAAQQVSLSMVWLYPKPHERVSKYSSERDGISEHEISIYHDRTYQPRSTHKLHRLITNQLILHHDERISKRISSTYDQYTDPRLLHPVLLKYW